MFTGYKKRQRHWMCIRVFLLFIAEAYQTSYFLLVTGSNHCWQGQAQLAHIWVPLLVHNDGR